MNTVPNRLEYINTSLAQISIRLIISYDYILEEKIFI